MARVENAANSSESEEIDQENYTKISLSQTAFRRIGNQGLEGDAPIPIGKDILFRLSKVTNNNRFVNHQYYAEECISQCSEFSDAQIIEEALKYAQRKMQVQTFQEIKNKESRFAHFFRRDQTDLQIAVNVINMEVLMGYLGISTVPENQIPYIGKPAQDRIISGIEVEGCAYVDDQLVNKNFYFYMLTAQDPSKCVVM